MKVFRKHVIQLTTCLVIVSILAMGLNLATASAAPPVGKNPDPGHVKGPGDTPARGGETELWVYPRNQSPRDARNVQWAVNNVASGGTVYLMSTDPDELEPKPFLFGYGPNSDRIVIGEVGNDVNIVGQTQLEYNPTTGRPTGNVIGIPTVIRGGHNTFVSGATGEDVYGIPGTNWFGARTPKVNLGIRNIIFEECFEMCIWIPGCTGLEVSGNKFVKPRLLGVNDPHPIGIAVFIGLGPDPDTIEWVRQNTFGLPPAGVTDHDVNGDVLIRGNYVQGEALSGAELDDFGPDDYPVLFGGTYYSGTSNGFGYNEGVDALVTIENNTVDTFLSSAVYAVSNKGTGDNTTIVRNNLITQGYHGWRRYPFHVVNLKSGDFLDNVVLDTDRLMWIAATSNLELRGNTASGDGQWGISVVDHSSKNKISILPGELEEFASPEFHIKFDATSTNNIVYLHGTTGLTIIDEDSNTIEP